jgi:hypothetical protein
MTGDVKYGVLEAGINLKNFIDKRDDICSIENGMKRPLIVLSFDEAHNIAEFPDDRGVNILGVAPLLVPAPWPSDLRSISVDGWQIPPFLSGQAMGPILPGRARQ